MCITHLLCHPCGHVTPCLPKNIESHCAAVQHELWTYHDQPNHPPLQQPMKMPVVCPSPPYEITPHGIYVRAVADAGVGVVGANNTFATQPPTGSVRAWTVPWGCGRNLGPSCRIEWGHGWCPWVSGISVDQGLVEWVGAELAKAKTEGSLVVEMKATVGWAHGREVIIFERPKMAGNREGKSEKTVKDDKRKKQGSEEQYGNHAGRKGGFSKLPTIEEKEIEANPPYKGPFILDPEWNDHAK